MAIQRGVKQGDIMSPLLFNCGLGVAMNRWKRQLVAHGFDVNRLGRLTNIRYADDLILFPKSSAELVDMIELLSEEFAQIALTLDLAKKIVTTFTLQNPTMIQVGNVFLEVSVGDDVHKYLGKILTGDLRNRGRLVIAHRRKVCWGKFHKHAHIPLNKNELL